MEILWKRTFTIALRLALLLVIVSLLQTPGLAQDPPWGDPSIVSPRAKLEKIFGEGTGFLGASDMSEDEILYVTDIGVGTNTGHIWRVDPQDGTSRIILSPSGKANGIMFDAHGRLIIAQGAELGGRRIVRIDVRTGKSMMLAATYNNLPFNAPNDIAIDDNGRIYFTDPSYFRYMNYEPVYQPIQGVYRIDPDSSVHLIIANVVAPNGITISPDQKTLYVTSADLGSLTGWVGTEGLARHIVPRNIHAFDLHEDASANHKGALIACEADGITIDVDGNIYAALLFQKRIGVFSPDGKELAAIPLPSGPTDVSFGRGKYDKTLFITIENSVHMIEVLKKGYHSPHLGAIAY